MTKLWIVILIFGHVEGTVGPLPYGVNECRNRVAVMNAEADRHDGNAPVMLHGRPVSRADVSIACVYADRRPTDDARTR